MLLHFLFAPFVIPKKINQIDFTLTRTHPISTLFIFLAIVTTSKLTYAQTLPPPVLYPGWERIFIKNVGSFDLPPTLEIRSELYTKFADSLLQIWGYDTATLTAQQKKLNETISNSDQPYARVILSTKQGNHGDYKNLFFDISTISEGEIIVLDSILKNRINTPKLGVQGQTIIWSRVKLEKINNMSCLHLNYVRQVENLPALTNHVYIFQNNDRLHSLTLSCNASEYRYWESDFKKIIESFRISTVR